MLGLQEFMLAIDHASGNKRYIEDIPDFENPILGENRLSSVNKEESHSRLDAVHSPTPTKGVRKPYLRSYTMIYMPLADIFFPRMYQTPDGFMAVRIQHVEFVIQTDETEFSSEIFLWRECQRHQNPNLGDADCESSADGDAEGIETTMELLRTGATKVRITLMYYVNFYSLFNNPEKEWDIILSKAFDAPSEPSLFD